MTNVQTTQDIALMPSLDTPVVIDKTMALDLLDACVAERGADYVHDQPSCRYLDYVNDEDRFSPSDDAEIDGVGCLVGLALTKVGVSRQTLLQMDQRGNSFNWTDNHVLNPVGVQVSPGAIDLFSRVQVMQDTKVSWGRAVQALRDDTDGAAMEEVCAR